MRVSQHTSAPNASIMRVGFVTFLGLTGKPSLVKMPKTRLKCAFAAARPTAAPRKSSR